MKRERGKEANQPVDAIGHEVRTRSIEVRMEKVERVGNNLEMVQTQDGYLSDVASGGREVIEIALTEPGC